MKILVAGDKAEERQLVVETIAQFDHIAVEAHDGESAWQAYLTHDFDIVISDLVMPKMNGLELCRAIRSRPKDHYTYVLIASLFSEKSHIMAGFEAGVDDYVGKPLDPDELRVRLISALRVTEIQRELATKNRQLEALSLELKAESRRDPLTGVGNRLRFQDDMPRYLDERLRYERSFWLGMCDIDNFKLYNDTYGHLAGDDVLRRVAQTLQRRIRKSDQLYRMGGEEFLVVLSCQDEASAGIAAERLRREVEALGIAHTGNDPHGLVTLSIGLSPFQASSLDEIDCDLQVADKLLYRGKSQGRNQVASAQLLANSSSNPS